MNTTNSTSTAVASPPAPAVRRLVPTRAYARIAELTAVLVSTDDFDTFRIHVLNRLGRSDFQGRARIEDLVRVVWRGRERLVSAADPVLRAASDVPPTPPAGGVADGQTSPWSGRAEWEAEVVRDSAVAAALLAVPAWIEAALQRDPPWGRDLTRTVAALDGAWAAGRWFQDLYRAVRHRPARWFGSGPR